MYNFRHRRLCVENIQKFGLKLLMLAASYSPNNVNPWPGVVFFQILLTRIENAARSIAITGVVDALEMEELDFVWILFSHVEWPALIYWCIWSKTYSVCMLCFYTLCLCFHVIRLNDHRPAFHIFTLWDLLDLLLYTAKIAVFFIIALFHRFCQISSLLAWLIWSSFSSTMTFRRFILRTHFKSSSLSLIPNIINDLNTIVVANLVKASHKLRFVMLFLFIFRLQVIMNISHRWWSFHISTEQLLIIIRRRRCWRRRLTKVIHL